MNDANTNYLKQHIDILSFRDLAPGTITTDTSYMTQFIEWTESLLSSKPLSDISFMSSLAQQEVESLSANVKMGLKMKMKRGEMIGFNGCLGYDYNPDDKSLSVNEVEADIVRFI